MMNIMEMAVNAATFVFVSMLLVSNFDGVSGVRQRNMRIIKVCSLIENSFVALSVGLVYTPVVTVPEELTFIETS